MMIPNRKSISGPRTPYVKNPIPPHPDRQACHVGNKPDQENTKEQSPAVHKISSIYIAPAIGFGR
jgi:hypothetical protein